MNQLSLHSFRRLLLILPLTFLLLSLLFLFSPYAQSHPIRTWVSSKIAAPPSCPPPPIPPSRTLGNSTPADLNATHLYRDDGLLETNHLGRHPIYELIERATEEWEGKLERQSKTLPEAVREYRRRYGRAPPKGFDKWSVVYSTRMK